MNEEARRLREIELLKSDISEFPAGKLDDVDRLEILRSLGEKEAKLRMVEMNRTRASPTRRVLGKITARVRRVLRRV